MGMHCQRDKLTVIRTRFHPPHDIRVDLGHLPWLGRLRNGQSRGVEVLQRWRDGRSVFGGLDSRVGELAHALHRSVCVSGHDCEDERSCEFLILLVFFLVLVLVLLFSKRDLWMVSKRALVPVSTGREVILAYLG